MSLELLAVLVQSFVVGLSGALMPGPLLTLTIAETARAGFRRGPAVVLGHAAVELVAVGGLLVGVSQLVQDAAVRGAIGVVGGLVLLWMGYGIGRSAWRGEAAAALSAALGEHARADPRLAPVGVRAGGGPAVEPAHRLGLLASPVLRGGAVSVVNPYWLLWWATIGAGYVGRSLELGVAGLVAFYVGHILSDLGWLSLVSLAVSSGRRALSQRVYLAVLLLCAAALVFLGAGFLWAEAPALLRSLLRS